MKPNDERVKKPYQWRKAVETRCFYCSKADVYCLYCLGRGYYFNTQDASGNEYEKPKENPEIYLTPAYVSDREKLYQELKEAKSQKRKIRDGYKGYLH